MYTVIDELMEPDYNYKSTMIPKFLLDMKMPEVDWESMRDPFIGPYTKADLVYLDALHTLMDLRAEWMASERREQILKGKRDKTISRERTRSKRWRAGSRSNKPKHFWPKRYRTSFR